MNNKGKIIPIIGKNGKEIKFMLPNRDTNKKPIRFSELIDFLTKTLQIAKNKFNCESCDIKVTFGTGFDAIFLIFKKEK